MVKPMSNFGIFETYRQRALALPMQRADNRLEWRRRYDEMSARETPDHPDCKGGPVEYINGPLAKPTFAPGSVEWEHQQRKKS
jgi:hypothetical protein